jgi:hypothetical protein
VLVVNPFGIGFIGDAGERRPLLWNVFLFWPMEGAVIINTLQLMSCIVN